jgi:hypothetical protein
VAVGRVPASTIEELESYVAKVIKYEHVTFGSDWFHNLLLIAGPGRKCDPGVHFEEIQHRFGLHFGDDFQFRTYIHTSYTGVDPDHSCRPCFCTATETTAECLARTGLSEDQVDVFADAMWAGTTWVRRRDLPVPEFEDAGFRSSKTLVFWAGTIMARRSKITVTT